MPLHGGVAEELRLELVVAVLLLALLLVERAASGAAAPGEGGAAGRAASTAAAPGEVEGAAPAVVAKFGTVAKLTTEPFLLAVLRLSLSSDAT